MMHDRSHALHHSPTSHHTHNIFRFSHSLPWPINHVPRDAIVSRAAPTRGSGGILAAIRWRSTRQRTPKRNPARRHGPRGGGLVSSRESSSHMDASVPTAPARGATINTLGAWMSVRKAGDDPQHAGGRRFSAPWQPHPVPLSLQPLATSHGSASAHGERTTGSGQCLE